MQHHLTIFSLNSQSLFKRIKSVKTKTLEPSDMRREKVGSPTNKKVSSPYNSSIKFDFSAEFSPNKPSTAKSDPNQPYFEALMAHNANMFENRKKYEYAYFTRKLGSRVAEKLAQDPNPATRNEFLPLPPVSPY